MIRFPEVRHPIRLAAVAVGVILVVVVFGSTCSAPERATLPPPDPTATTRPEETTTTVDHSRTVLQAVAGQTTTTLADSGDAVLRGSVSGPAGPVPDAVVRVERLVRDAVQVFEVRTGEDGGWVLEGIPGGRMRVRAFAPPTLTMLEPEVFFLTASEPRDLQLVVREHQGLVVLSDVTPSAPTVGSPVSLAVRVMERVVGDDGVARTRPLPGQALQVRSSGWVFIDGPGATDGDGTAVFTYRCEQAGTVTAAAVVLVGAEEQTFPLDVPSCGPRPTTTTTTTTTEPDDEVDPDEETTSTSAPTTTEDD